MNNLVLDGEMMIREFLKAESVDISGSVLPEYIDRELFDKFMRLLKSENVEDVADISDEDILTCLENLGSLTSVLDFEHKMDDTRLSNFLKKKSQGIRRVL